MRSLFFASAILLVLIESKIQTVWVTGVTVCNKKPARADIDIKERDWFGPDDTLASTESSKDGKFSVMGRKNEFFTLDPYLVITHTCNVKKKGCKRISEYQVPKEMVGRHYKMSYVSLDIMTSNDKEKC
uniref:Uncharacterized protein n=1 Tax=Caenorhabditis japonica TaxID=281687 RepID=A0A8R1DHB0_CAEJA